MCALPEPNRMDVPISFAALFMVVSIVQALMYTKPARHPYLHSIPLLGFHEVINKNPTQTISIFFL